MKIPAKFQIFDTAVVLTSKDEQRLMGYLTGWMKLADLLAGLNESDITRLVVMELLGKQRRKILGRLLMRLGRVQRKRIEERITKCLSKSQNPKSRKRS